MRTSILTLTLTLGLASAAAATPITFTFTATQVSANAAGAGGLAETAAQFATISGSISYDLATAASSSNVTVATYPTGALVVDQFNVGAGVFTSPLQIRVANDAGLGGDAFTMSNSFALSGMPPGIYDSVALRLADTGGTALTSVALPSSLSLFGLTDTLLFERDQYTATGGSTFVGSTAFLITSIQPAATTVPEPATLILLGSGLAAGLGRRMRKRT
jgi:hypothetical protein